MHRPVIASCGIGFVIAELASRAALAGAQPRTEMFAEHLPMDRAGGIHRHVHRTARGLGIPTPMFPPPWRPRAGPQRLTARTA